MVFCYDIGSDRRRARVADLLEQRAVRVQQSVFEARLTAVAAQRLADRLWREMDPDDSLRVYAVTAAGLRASLSRGGAPLAEDREFWLL